MIGLNTITRATGHGSGRQPLALLIGIAAGVVLVWGGCSTEKHYELLSFFFDGVPDPNEVHTLNGMAVSESPTFSEHQPFVNDECMSCHADPSEMQLKPDDSSLCLKCHEDKLDEYPVMHGAVVGLACLRCHKPHFSNLANLIREETPGLCYQCHGEFVMGSPNPPHNDPEQDCLSCHMGHGGTTPSFLRDPVPEEQSEPSVLRSATDDAP